MKLFTLLLIIITVAGCNSQNKPKNAQKSKIAQQKENFIIKNDSIYFSVQDAADSLFIYTSTVGYEKAEKRKDYFIKSYQQDSLDYSYFTYSFYEFKDGIQSNVGNGIHNGKHFPKSPKYIKEFKGNISTIPIKSKYLREVRNIFIYTPLGFNKNKEYNLLLILDANKGTVKRHSSLIENLISKDKIEDLIIVGIPNKEFAKDDKYSEEIDFRALEFLEGFATSNHHGHSEIPKELINRHNDFINFLEKEVYQYVINRYKITDNYYKKSIYGVSNGGAFVVSLSRKKPNLFGSNMAFSFGWDNNVKEPIWSDTKLPNFYLAVGKHEIGFNDTVKKWKTILETQGTYNEFSEQLSGHDRKMWDIMFVKYIEKIYRK